MSIKTVLGGVGFINEVILRCDDDLVVSAKLWHIVEVRKGRMEPRPHPRIAVSLALNLSLHRLKLRHVECAVLHKVDILNHLRVGDAGVLAGFGFPDDHCHPHFAKNLHFIERRAVDDSCVIHKFLSKGDGVGSVVDLITFHVSFLLLSFRWVLP